MGERGRGGGLGPGGPLRPLALSEPPAWETEGGRGQAGFAVTAGEQPTRFPTPLGPSLSVAPPGPALPAWPRLGPRTGLGGGAVGLCGSEGPPAPAKDPQPPRRAPCPHLARRLSRLHPDFPRDISGGDVTLAGHAFISPGPRTEAAASDPPPLPGFSAWGRGSGLARFLQNTPPASFKVSQSTGRPGCGRTV